MISATQKSTMSVPAAALLALAALAAGAAAFLLPGAGRTDVWQLLVGSAGFALAGAIALRGAPVAAFFVGLFFFAGSAQLWLTEPDWFPSLRLKPADGFHAAMLAATGLQLALSLAGLAWFARNGLGLRLLKAFGPIRIAAVLFLTCVFAVSIMSFIGRPGFARFFVNLAGGGVVTFALVANAAAIAAAPDLRRVSIGDAHAARLSAAAPVGLAVFATIVSALLSWRAFGGAAIVEDEVAYLFQARTFAAGALFAPPLPPGTEKAFEFYLIKAAPEGWYSVTAPGWPAMLALGVIAGAPWLVNPILGGGAVYAAHRLTERLADRQHADLAALLMATSPWLHGASASLMTQALCLALMLFGWLFIVVAKEKADGGKIAQAIFFALAAGAAMGWMFLTRSLEGVLIGGATGLFALYAFRKPAHWGAIIAYGAGCVLIGALLFPYNAAYTGEALVAPQAVYIKDLWVGGANAFGFGDIMGPPKRWGALDLWDGHSPLEGVINVLNGMTSLSFELFGWGAASLFLVWCWLFWGRRAVMPAMMAGLVAVIIVIHFFYWYNDVYYIGPRYWYSAFYAFVFLSVAGLIAIRARLKDAGATNAPARLVCVVLALSAFSVVGYTSWRGLEKYGERSTIGRGFAAIAASPDARGALYLIADRDLADEAMIFNDPFRAETAPLFAHAPDAAAEARLIEAFPGRRLVRLAGPTLETAR